MVIVNNPLNSKKSLINIIEGDKNIVVFRFTSISCGPCQTVKPKIEEFKEQLPNKEFNGVESKVLVEDKIKDDSGTRFLLIGEIR